MSRQEQETPTTADTCERCKNAVPPGSIKHELIWLAGSKTVLCTACYAAWARVRDTSLAALFTQFMGCEPPLRAMFMTDQTVHTIGGSDRDYVIDPPYVVPRDGFYTVTFDREKGTATITPIEKAEAEAVEP